MTIFVYRFVSSTALLLAVAALTPAIAQDTENLSSSTVRLFQVSGGVAVRHGDAAPWAPAVVDAPLANGDRLATGPQGQADIQLDNGNVFHLGARAEVRFDRLEPGIYRFSVLKGVVTCHVAGSSAADVEVGTPTVAVRASRPGVYLIGVNRRGQSEITVRAGDVEVVAPRGSEWVNTGQKMIVRGSAADPQYKIGNAIPLWRRVAVVMADWVQIAASISSSVSSDSGGNEESNSGKTAASPGRPSAPPAPARQQAPSPPHHDGNRGKG